MAEESSPIASPAATPAIGERARRLPRRRSVRGGGRSRSRGAWSIAIVLAIVVIVGAGWWGYRTVASRIQAIERTDAATALIESADAVVVQADSVIREKVTPELADAALGASKRIPAATSDLRKAVRLLDEARPLGAAGDQHRIDLLARAAEARIRMLEQAPKVLDLNVSASEALPMAREAWKNVLAADKLSDKAVVSYNKLTKVGVKASNSYNKQAASALASARQKFEAADRSFSEAPFEQYLAYVDARIRLNDLSQKSDAAWLKGDVKTANAVIKTYNIEDKKAVALAKLLPASPDQAIADAYELAAKAATDAYYKAREAATKADASLRKQ